jgi:hypothetical protein
MIHEQVSCVGNFMNSWTRYFDSVSCSVDAES